jgi:hypothetical protein
LRALLPALFGEEIPMHTVSVAGVLAAVAATLIAGPAAAGGAGDFIAGDSGSGLYFGASVGGAQWDDTVDANNDGSLSNINEDDSDTAFRVGVGYAWEHVGVEGGYMDVGESSFSATSSGGESWSPGDVSTTVEGDGWYLALIGRWPIAARWTALGFLGLYAWETSETYTETPAGGGPTITSSGSDDSGTDAYYGVGVEYDIGTEEKWIIRGDVTRTEVDDDGLPVSSASVGAYRRF